MAYQFRPGQKVRYIAESVPGKVVQHGEVGEFVTYEPIPKNLVEGTLFKFFASQGKYVLVETRFHERRWICATAEIVPVDDGAEGSTWENCVWNPNKSKVEA
jgi:hypothetical protein